MKIGGGHIVGKQYYNTRNFKKDIKIRIKKSLFFSSNLSKKIITNNPIEPNCSRACYNRTLRI